MKKSVLVLVGLMTAAMLSSTTVFADDSIRGYYKEFVQREIKNMSNEDILEAYKEILNKQVEVGILEQTSAEKKILDAKNGELPDLTDIHTLEELIGK